MLDSAVSFAQSGPRTEAKNARRVRAIQAEESPSDALLLRKLLGSPFQVDWHSQPLDALQKLSRQCPDIVLVGSGSFDLAAWIQHLRDIAPSVPVVVMTQAGEAFDLTQSGADEHVVKGQVTGPELQAILYRLIDAGERERVEGEVHSACGLQRSLLPADIPRLERVEVAAKCWPANSLSGDWYDFLPLAGGLGLMVGDVTGHDLAASLLMATTRAYLRALGLICGEPVTLISQVNHLLSQDVGTSRFVTLGLLLLEPEELTARVVLAGHPPPLKVDKKGGLSSLDSAPNLPLGINLGAQFPASEVYDLQSGDVLLLYTDGFEDVCDGAGWVFGRERLAETLRLRRSLSSKEILEGLHEEVMAFSREGHIPDDLTAVVLKVL